MNKINKNNVEAYYLDYLEGSLSPSDTDELLLFIDNHPELAELFDETDDLTEYILTPTELSFGDTEALKTFPCDEDEICLENIDYWLIAKSENTLAEGELEAVNNFVAENKLHADEAFVSAAYLQPNLSESFGDTMVLKRQGGIILPLLLRVSAIAAIFIFIWLVWKPKSSVENNYFARTMHTEKTATPEYLSPNNKNFGIGDSEITNPSPSVVVQENAVINKQELPTIKGKENHFDLLKEKFENINVSNDIAFNNPPSAMTENFELEEFFSDFETLINAEQKFEDYNYAQIQHEEPVYSLQEQYRPVTKTLSNLTSLDMSYKKMPEAADVKQTVIQIGKFSFERKLNK
jgi:hypothetical protein